MHGAVAVACECRTGRSQWTKYCMYFAPEGRSAIPIRSRRISHESMTQTMDVSDPPDGSPSNTPPRCCSAAFG